MWNRTMKVRLPIVLTVMFVLLAVLQPNQALSQSDAKRLRWHSPDYTKEIKPGSTPKRPFAIFNDDLPEKFESVIQTMRKRRGYSVFSRDAVVLTGESNVEYLAVIWAGFEVGEVFEIHRLDYEPNGEIVPAFLQELKGSMSPGFRFHKLTGTQVFPEEPTVVVVFDSLGGSHPENYRLKAFQMKRNAVEISLKDRGRLIAIQDMDDDGSHEFITIDGRWALSISTCGSCGPWVPVIHRRNDERFNRACRDFSEAYRPGIVRTGEMVFDLSYNAFDRLLAAQYAAMFSAQIGEMDEAYRYFSLIIPLIREFNSTDPERQIKIANDLHLASLDKAAQLTDRPCPLSAIPRHR